jgi:glucose-6-phosphate isomerase
LGKKRISTERSCIKGIAVYGNKGSTDPTCLCATVARRGFEFFRDFHRSGQGSAATERSKSTMESQVATTSTDFCAGREAALYESGRESITMSIPEANAFSIGALIALYERAVGFYGSLVNINAYDQPGVEAGKKSSDKIIAASKTSAREIDS